MKKSLLLIAVLACICPQIIKAQYFTLRVAGGYAWPGLTNPEGIIGPKIDPFTADKDGLAPMAFQNDTLHTYKPVRGSYGKGMNFTLAPGYMINKYIGVELGISYLQSVTYSSDQTRQLTVELAPGPPAQFGAIPAYMQVHATTKAFGLSLMPAVVFRAAKPSWKVYPYGRVGISLPVFGGLTHKVGIDVDPAVLSVVQNSPYFLGKHTDVTLKTEGTVSIGFNGALGVAYNPLSFLAISFEINAQHLVTRAKSAKITQWDTDGQSRIAERGVYRTQFNFVDELTSASNNDEYNNYKSDKTKPKDDIRPTGPFSNIGFNIGVSFLLGKETLPKKKKKEADKK